MKEAWNYTPINYVITQNVRFDVRLPEYVDANQIGVNLPRVEKLLNLGGIRHLRVTNQTDGETSKSVPVVVGVTKNGEALAGRTSISPKVPTYSTNLDLEKKDPDLPYFLQYQSYKWANGEVKVNIDEIATKIAREALWNDGVRSTNAWAHHLDDSIKQGIINIGLHHMIQVDDYNKVEFLATTAFGAIFAAGLMPFGWNPHLPAFQDALASILFQHQGMNALAYIRGKIEKIGNFRWSVFQGIEPDRALALKVLTQRKNLIKAFPTKEA